VEDNKFDIKRHHRKENDKEDRFRSVRQLLNLIFMIGAVIGVCVYFFHVQTIGTIIILVAMVFKIVECVLRIMK